MLRCWALGKRFFPLPITHYQLPITNYPLPITHYQLPITNYLPKQLYKSYLFISLLTDKLIYPINDKW
ncbi:hypothetical protein [Fischerella thermalis]|uniref:hypothetical protein n=1 Tax=Fischerella thermalis TaxID=372787 RepID=UPI00307D95FD